MEEFLRTATSFPAVVWSVLVLVSLGFWAVSALLGLGSDGIEIETGDGADGLTGLEVASSLDLVSALGLNRAPLAVVVTATTLIGWLLAMLVTLSIGRDQPIAVGLVVLVASLILALVTAGRVARLVGPLYAPNRGTTHTDLVGRLCTVRTGRVDGGFGQAEVVDAEGGSHLVQVRCPEPNELTGGSRALIVDVDDGLFRIDPDTGGLD